MYFKKTFHFDKLNRKLEISNFQNTLYHRQALPWQGGTTPWSHHLHYPPNIRKHKIRFILITHFNLSRHLLICIFKVKVFYCSTTFEMLSCKICACKREWNMMCSRSVRKIWFLLLICSLSRPLWVKRWIFTKILSFQILPLSLLEAFVTDQH